LNSVLALGESGQQRRLPGGVAALRPGDEQLLAHKEHCGHPAEHAQRTELWPNLAPSMVKPATPSENATIAVITVVGAVLNSALMPPIETRSALMFHDICAWPIAIAAIGSQEVFSSVASPAVERLFMGAVPGVCQMPKREW
jgi:hypothetical protein